jgi:hypothetical protein
MVFRFVGMGVFCGFTAIKRLERFRLRMTGFGQGFRRKAEALIV